MKIRQRLKIFLGAEEPPQRVAAAFAVGVFLGMSPLLGLHTVLALLAAWAFKLNKFAAITGVYITNPWTIVPIYAFSIWVGSLLTGTKDLVPDIDWNHLTMSGLFTELRPLLLPFVIGTTLVGAASAFLSYAFIKKAIEKAKKRPARPRY